MLGIVLVTVGFVLLHNGWFGFAKKALDGKAASVVNFLGGGVIFAAALYTLRSPEPDYFTAAIYFLVALTYIYIGFDSRYGLDARPFGVFCLTGSIALLVGGILTINGGIATWREAWLLICWFSWAALWFILFIECALEKKLGKLTPALCLLQAAYTGLIPGVMMLAGWW
jgi:hypothetical protein